jgi:hypothetical protein
MPKRHPFEWNAVLSDEPGKAIKLLITDLQGSTVYSAEAPESKLYPGTYSTWVSLPDSYLGSTLITAWEINQVRFHETDIIIY